MLGKGFAKKFKVPFPSPIPPKDALYSVRFDAPHDINVVGSYSLGMAARMRGGFNVDLMIQMPPTTDEQSSLFQEKDHLNYRYFYKRAYYMAVIELVLLGSELADHFEIERDLLRQDERLPVLLVRPKVPSTAPGKRRASTVVLSDLDFSHIGAVIRIIPTIATTVLPLKRLSPERNNVRQAFLETQLLGVPTKGEGANGVSGDMQNIGPATPRYNAAILGDALVATCTKFIYSVAQRCPGFVDAVILAKVWWRQRGYGAYAAVQCGVTSKAPGNGAINGFALTMILAWLVAGYDRSNSGSRLSTGMSSYQLFKGLLAFLAQHDFGKTPLAFRRDAMSDDGPGVFEIDAFAKHYPAVLVDPTGRLNILAGVSKWELAHLQFEARSSLDYLEDGSHDRFVAIFLQSVESSALVADHAIRVELPDTIGFRDVVPSASDAGKVVAAVDYGNYYRALVDQVVELLQRGLAKRVALIVPRCQPIAESEEQQLSPKMALVLNVTLDREHALRLVELGPQPELEKEAANHFEALWGDKSELRRFRDGSVRLATVWGHGGDNSEQRSLIIPRMIAYLLRYHFGILAAPEVLTSSEVALADKGPGSSSPMATSVVDTRLTVLSARLDWFLASRDDPSPSSVLTAADPAALPPPDTFEHAIRALNQLSSEFSAMDDDLPLRILSIHGVAPGLRYTSVRPPKLLRQEGETRPDDSYIEPLHILVEFERSSRWPDDLVIIQKLKMAFLQRLAELYTRRHPDSSYTSATRLFGYGQESGALVGAPGFSEEWRNAGPDEPDTFVDLYHGSSGLTFRLSAKHEPEGYIMRRLSVNFKAAGERAKHEEMETALKRWRQVNEWQPDHHRRIHALCQRYHPAASMAIRLFKRWLASHMLLNAVDGVPEEIAELMVARVFTEPAPYLTTPATSYAGFARTLRLLTEWDWKEEPMVVDFAASEAPDGQLIDGVTANTSNKNGDSINTKTIKGMLPEARNAIYQAFEEAKSQGRVNGGWYIVTESDPKCERWGGISSPVLARRLRALSKASLACLSNAVSSGSEATLSRIFVTPLADYDFLIHLDRSLCCRQFEQPPPWAFTSEKDSQGETSNGDGDAGNADSPGLGKFKNLLPLVRQQLVAARDHPNPFGQPGMVEFDPVALYVRDLRALYHPIALFFYDLLGGSTIGGIWNPKLRTSQIPLKTQIQFNLMPARDPPSDVGTKANKGSKGDGGKGQPDGWLPNAVQPNCDAILNEILTLGEGL
ncbi:U3 snoRNP protein, partial [Spiromyces aspiralis]